MTNTPSSSALDGLDDGALAERLADASRRITTELRKVIVGQDAVVEQALIALFAGGNCLLVGVPGLAKTLLIHSLSRALDLRFSRIQFTPDLMPSDVTGTDMITDDPETGRRKLAFLPGPIFANVVLADEINRTPPKTQAALMEAMEERTVTSLGIRRPLDRPFLVLATQNPIEQQGTYPLPAAQLDRFLFKIRLEYPTLDDEARIVRLTTATLAPPTSTPVVTKAGLVAFQMAVAYADVPPALLRYAVDLVRASRPADPQAPPRVRDYVTWGVGPRAAQALVSGAKARAFLRGRATATFDDVRALAPAVFRHRLVCSYAADADGVSPDDITKALLEHVPYPGRSEARGEPSRVARWWRALMSPSGPKTRSPGE